MMDVHEANQEYYDAVSSCYDRKHGISTSDFAAFSADLADLGIKRLEGKSILDCGAGTGRGAIKFALMKNNVFALDVSLGIIRTCRMNARQRGVRVEVQVGDAACLPLADGSFDVVTTSAALHHIVEVGAALVEFYRVLRPGGRIILLAEPKTAWIRPRWLREMKERTSDRFDRENGVERRGDIDPDVHLFELGSLVGLARSVGFSSIRTQTFSCLGSLYHDCVFYRLRNLAMRDNIQSMLDHVDRKSLRHAPRGLHARFHLTGVKEG